MQYLSLRSALTQAENHTGDIQEKLDGLNPQIEIGSWIRPIINAADGPTVVISAGYREALAKALDKLPFVERGKLEAVIGRDPSRFGRSTETFPR
jgi:hypothetical protein